MEKEKRELKQESATEKRELKQESATEKRDKVHKKMNKKFFLLVPVLIVLGVALFIILRETGGINKYVYEEVDNLSEREGVCFDNLLFSYYIEIACEDQSERRRLCIMNNGDVYAFIWTNYLSPWDFYYSEDYSEFHSEGSEGYDEANWGKMENVVYLGRFSDRAVMRLNSYMENYDFSSKYYFLNPPQLEVPDGGGSQQVREDMEAESKEVEWRAYGARLYWHRMSGDIWIEGDNRIEWSYMNRTWWGGYEKEIQERSLDENAIAAIELFESSGFYDRWVKMCLNGY